MRNSCLADKIEHDYFHNPVPYDNDLTVTFWQLEFGRITDSPESTLSLVIVSVIKRTGLSQELSALIYG